MADPTLDAALALLSQAASLSAKGLELVQQHKAELEAQKKAIQNAEIKDEPDPRQPPS